MLISRGCPWASMKRGGCKFGGCCQWPKTGGCSFAVGTQAQRVSAPLPPGSLSHFHAEKFKFHMCALPMNDTYKLSLWEFFFQDFPCNIFIAMQNPRLFSFFFNCMFYQLLRVQHSCSSTQSWGSVLPSTYLISLDMDHKQHMYVPVTKEKKIAFKM